MTNGIETYRARFRFKVLKKLSIPEHKHEIKVAGRDVVISPPQTDPPPLKWSDLRYVFDIQEDCNGKEAIQA